MYSNWSNASASMSSLHIETFNTRVHTRLCGINNNSEEKSDTSIHVSTGPQLILLSAIAEKRDR